MKRIIFIELLHHHECLENPYLTFKDKWYKTQAILWEFVAKQLKNIPQYKDEFFIVQQPRRKLFSSLHGFQKIKYVFYQFWEIYKNTQEIIQIVKKQKPDILYINTIESPFLIPFMLYLIRLENIKIYLTLHNTNRLKEGLLKYFLFDFLIKRLIQKADKIILLGEYLKFKDTNIQQKVMYINNRIQKKIRCREIQEENFCYFW